MGFKTFAQTGLVKQSRTDEGGGCVDRYFPTELNGFEVNDCGVVLNPVRLEFSNKKAHFEIRLAQISQGVWAWGTSIMAANRQWGGGCGCSTYPLFDTALEAVFHCLLRFASAGSYGEEKGDYSEFIASSISYAINEDFQLPIVEIL